MFRIVELLVSRGVNVNAQNSSGKTALMLAAFSGHLDIIKELRNNGASYDIRDFSGCTVLHYAVDGGVIESIRYFLMDGIDVNARDNNGWTPLIRAASINCTGDVAEILLKFNAEVNAIDKDRKSALMIAVINGNQPFVETLVQHGADLEIRNDYGRTAYEIAYAMDRRVSCSLIFFITSKSCSYTRYTPVLIKEEDY